MIVIIAVLALILLSLRTYPGRIFWSGGLFDNDLDRYSSSTIWHGDPQAPSPWLRASRAERVAVRAAHVALALLYIVGLFLYPLATLCVLLVIAAALIGYGIWLLYRRIITYKLRRNVIRPLFYGLLNTVGWHDTTNPAHVIITNKDYRNRGILIKLPLTYERLESTLDDTAEIAAQTLGGHWEATWDLVGEPTVQLRHAPPPPDEVTWDELEHYLTAIDPSQLLLGLGSRNRLCLIDLDSDTPHLMLSVPSGGGKSVAVAMLASQVLHNGGQLVLIDLKRDTHWIKTTPGSEDLIPGVTYCRTPEEAHTKLVELGHLMEARYQTKEADPNYAPHRILIVAEELNMTADLLNSHWADLKQRGTSPALKTLRSLMYAGRACRMHVLAITQYGTAQAFGTTGGGAARENAARILGGNSSENAWEMLAPQVKPRPQMTDHVGRMFLIEGDLYKTVQVGYLTDQQARDWATRGVKPPDQPPTTQAFIGIL